MDVTATSKIIRQLQRAEGYIELRMPERALVELNAIGDEDSAFEAAIALLRGEALVSQERYTEAVDLLKRAARLIPAPLNKRAWRSLSECYRHSGREELAEVADLIVNSADPEADTRLVIRVAIVPMQSLSEAVQRLLEELATPKNSSGVQTDDGE